MCGIFGYTGDETSGCDIVCKGLAKLEYRGYDSWGCSGVKDDTIETRKDVGRITPSTHTFTSSTCIGHTRWATHGGVTVKNTHPHLSSDESIAIVHNGIIENYTRLKEEFNLNNTCSETDSEIIALLLEHFYDGSLENAMAETVRRLEGTFAIAAIHKDSSKIVVAKRGSPLIIGLGEHSTLISSDIPALLEHTKRVVFLEDEQIAILENEKLRLRMFSDDTPVEYHADTIDWDVSTAEKDGYDHFMKKEIMQQPECISQTIKANSFCDDSSLKRKLDSLAIKRIIIVACGTSWHAGLVGEFLTEGLAGIPVEVEYASEFRYRYPPLDKDTVLLAISQSGETADTLSAIREAKKRGLPVISICNVKGSSIDRASDVTLYTQAGPEIGVASTKAFTTQLTVLYLFTAYLSKRSTYVSHHKIEELYNDITKVPKQISSIFDSEKDIIAIASQYVDKKNALYLGRGIQYPIALEGALKLKEVSYLHAEGYPAAEMKHGPIALIDPDMPSIVIATRDETEGYEKVLSNIQEIKARGGDVIAIATQGDERITELADNVIFVPESRYALSAFLSVVPLQLLAYHIARLRRCDIDKPRNLAKSVTVE